MEAQKKTFTNFTHFQNLYCKFLVNFRIETAILSMTRTRNLFSSLFGLLSYFYIKMLFGINSRGYQTNSWLSPRVLTILVISEDYSIFRKHCTSIQRIEFKFVHLKSRTIAIGNINFVSYDSLYCNNQILESNPCFWFIGLNAD